MWRLPSACIIAVLINYVQLSTSTCVNGARFGCASCSTVSICSYAGTEVTRFRCDSVDPTRPFCNSGRCEQAPVGNCIQPSELCPRSSATFPQPTSCFQYVSCDTQKGALRTTCSPANYVYDHSIGQCRARRTVNDCFQVNCGLAANVNRWFVYQPVPRLAFFCSDAVGPMTFECSGAFESFDARSRSCVFSCPREGLFPNPSDVTKYYECSRGAYNALILTLRSCNGLIFDESTLRCTVPPTTTTSIPTTGTVALSTTESSSTSVTTTSALTTQDSLSSSTDQDQSTSTASTSSGSSST